MKLAKLLLPVPVVAALGGCATNQNLPLIYAQSTTVGISITATTDEQGGTFVLGFKDKNVAVVPVTVSNSDGGSSYLGSTSGEEFEDAFSVLGQFEVDSKSTTGDVSLGRFFSTGSAAKSLADGFSCKLAGGPAKDCGFGDQQKLDR
jgi:hypothetical protein